MKEATVEMAKLAMRKGFDLLNNPILSEKVGKGMILTGHRLPLLWELIEFIRDERGVNLTLERNASGWFWGMCKSEGGTDLGYSEFSGPNHGGVWDDPNEALENGIWVQLTTDLYSPNHWGNYAREAIKKFNQKG